MVRYSGCSPLLVAFIVACILLFTAFHSSGGSKSISDWRSSNFLSGGSKHDDLAARLKYSEKLFQDSVAGRKIMKEYYDKNPRKFPKEYVVPYNLYDFVYPAFNCPHDLERVGRVGDGGKWVCGMTRYEANKDRPCVIYSFGVSDDSTFENEMLTRTNCEIWGYDFSVDGWASQMNHSFDSRTHFTRAGISNITDNNRSPPHFTVKDLMRANGHDYIDIMKMDIEGSEFDALGAFLADYSSPLQELPMGQLLLETHIRAAEATDPFTIPQTVPTWIAFWEAMEAKGLREVSFEPNLLGNTWYGAPVFAETVLINIADRRSLLL